MVVSGMSSDAAILPEDPALLKAMIVALQAENARMSATIRAHEPADPDVALKAHLWRGGCASQD